VAGDFDDVRVVVEALSEEFDPIDIAAAAVKMAHEAMGGSTDDKEIPAPGYARHEGTGDGRRVRLFINAGRPESGRPIRRRHHRRGRRAIGVARAIDRDDFHG
jgi:ATP-dependent RNA helicase DeaD